MPNINDNQMPAEKKDQANTAPAKEENIILDNILSQKKEESSMKSILDSSLEETPLRKVSRFSRGQAGWRLLQFSALSGLLVFCTFYILLDAKYKFITKVFGDPYPIKAEKSQEDVINKQTAINEKNLLIAKLNLDKFVYAMDSYTYNKNLLFKKKNEYEKIRDKSVYISTKKKLEDEIDKLTTEVDASESMIGGFLKTVKEKLDYNIWPPETVDQWGEKTEELAVIFKTKLTADINQNINNLQNSEKGAAPENNIRQEIQDLSNTLDILNSVKLKQTLDKIPDFDNLKAEEAKNILKVINEVAKNNFSIVAKIKSERVPWSQIIGDIEKVTASVDPLYGHPELGKDRIRYISYQFDSAKNQIVLSGSTYTEDGKNFTLIANLIDAFESSLAFKDVNLRTFSKSESNENQPFVAPLNLSFLKQGEDEKDPRDTELSLGEEELSDESTKDEVKEEDKTNEDAGLTETTTPPVQ